jgi:PAS domain S-box-containing protein
MRKPTSVQEALDRADVLTNVILLPGVIVGWLIWLAQAGHPAGVTLVVFSTALALLSRFVLAVADGNNRVTYSTLVVTSALPLGFNALLVKTDVAILWSVLACGFMLGVYATAYWIEGRYGGSARPSTPDPLLPTPSSHELIGRNGQWSRVALPLGTAVGATFAAFHGADAAETVRDCLIVTGLTLMCWLAWVVVRGRNESSQQGLAPGRERKAPPRAAPPAALDALQSPALPRSSATVALKALIEPDIPLTENVPDTEPWQTLLLEYTHDAIIIWEMNGQGIVYWNRGAEQLYGYSRTAARGCTTHELLKTELTGGVTHLESSLAHFGIWAGELRHTTSRGNSVLVEGRLTLMSQHNGRWLVLEVNRDITDRKVAEAASRAMQRQLAELRAKQGEDRDGRTTPG